MWLSFCTVDTTTMTADTELHARNGHVQPEPLASIDSFDHSYKEQEGPKPPKEIVWKNVILMTFLHIGALYGLFQVPSASYMTLLWCKYFFLHWIEST